MIDRDGPAPGERPRRIVRPYRVRFDEAAADDTIRTSVYLAWIADCAWQHSAQLGFDRAWYSERGLFWLVRALQLDVLRPLETYAEVAVSTEVVGFRRIAARRLSEVRRASGELVARAEIDWVMTNERGLPTRVPVGFDALFGATIDSFEMRRVAARRPPSDALAVPLDVRRRDLDPLGHVNNAAYLDYLEEALLAAGQAELLRAAPRRYVLEYVAAATPRERLIGSLWPAADGWSFRLAREDGGDLLRASAFASGSA